MDIIKRGLIFDDTALVSVIDITQIYRKAAKIHKLSGSSARFLGEALTAAAFMSVSLADAENKLSFIIDGAKAGKIVAAADFGAKVRGYIENTELSDEENELGEGFLEVIKDLGLKEPYSGKIPLVGSLAKTFACYFTSSEQIPTALALGAGERCGGVAIQALPNCGEDALFLLDDAILNFSDVSAMLGAADAEEILKFHFGHFGLKPLPDVLPEYRCKCSRSKIDGIVMGLGEKEAREIVAERGFLEAHCAFCQTDYRYGGVDLDRLFGVVNGGNN